MTIEEVDLRIFELNKQQKKKILVVEDNMINSIVLKKILESNHFEVSVAEDGKLGVEATLTFHPDLILMDINMPVMNGYESTIAIRNLEAPFNAIPIFAVTAELSPETIVKVKEAGMNEYFPKPVDVNELMTTILNYIK
jgi:CheY-like chemotaxis protein